jgi:hypothetical protein
VIQSASLKTLFDLSRRGASAPQDTRAVLSPLLAPATLRFELIPRNDVASAAAAKVELKCASSEVPFPGLEGDSMSMKLWMTQKGHVQLDAQKLPAINSTVGIQIGPYRFGMPGFPQPVLVNTSDPNESILGPIVLQADKAILRQILRNTMPMLILTLSCEEIQAFNVKPLVSTSFLEALIVRVSMPVVDDIFIEESSTRALFGFPIRRPIRSSLTERDAWAIIRQVEENSAKSSPPPRPPVQARMLQAAVSDQTSLGFSSLRAIPVPALATLILLGGPSAFRNNTVVLYGNATLATNWTAPVLSANTSSVEFQLVSCSDMIAAKDCPRSFAAVTPTETAVINAISDWWMGLQPNAAALRDGNFGLGALYHCTEGCLDGNRYESTLSAALVWYPTFATLVPSSMLAASVSNNVVLPGLSLSIPQGIGIISQDAQCTSGSVFFVPPSWGYCLNAASPLAAMCAYGAGRDCKRCGTTAICPGGYSALPRPGYWSFDGISLDSIIPCDPPSRCVGWNLTVNAPACAPGYRFDSPGCRLCVDGYYASSSGLCERCPAAASWRALAMSLLKLAGYVLAAATIVFLAIFALHVRFGGTIWGGVQRGVKFIIAALVVVQSVVSVNKRASPGLPPMIRRLYASFSVLHLQNISVPPECVGETNPFRGSIILFAVALLVLVFYMFSLTMLRCIRLRTIELDASRNPSLSQGFESLSPLVVLKNASATPNKASASTHVPAEKKGDMGATVLKNTSKVCFLSLTLLYALVTSQSYTVLRCADEAQMSVGQYFKLNQNGETWRRAGGSPPYSYEHLAACAQTGSYLGDLSSCGPLVQQALSQKIPVRTVFQKPSLVCMEGGHVVPYYLGIACLALITILWPAGTTIFVARRLRRLLQQIRAENRKSMALALAAGSIAVPNRDTGLLSARKSPGMPSKIASPSLSISSSNTASNSEGNGNYATEAEIVELEGMLWDLSAKRLSCRNRCKRRGRICLARVYGLPPVVREGKNALALLQHEKLVKDDIIEPSVSDVYRLSMFWMHSMDLYCLAIYAVTNVLDRSYNASSALANVLVVIIPCTLFGFLVATMGPYTASFQWQRPVRILSLFLTVLSALLAFAVAMLADPARISSTSTDSVAPWDDGSVPLVVLGLSYGVFSVSILLAVVFVVTFFTNLSSGSKEEHIAFWQADSTRALALDMRRMRIAKIIPFGQLFVVDSSTFVEKPEDDAGARVLTNSSVSSTKPSRGNFPTNSRMNFFTNEAADNEGMNSQSTPLRSNTILNRRTVDMRSGFAAILSGQTGLQYRKRGSSDGKRRVV